MSPPEEELNLIVVRLRQELLDYNERPHAYDFDTFHSAWCQKLHALGCSLAATRGRFCHLNENHSECAVGTALAHWGGLSWQPPITLTSDEWDAVVYIAHAIGIRGMPEYRLRQIKKAYSMHSCTGLLERLHAEWCELSGFSMDEDEAYDFMQTMIRALNTGSDDFRRLHESAKLSMNYELNKDAWDRLELCIGITANPRQPFWPATEPDEVDEDQAPPGALLRRIR